MFSEYFKYNILKMYSGIFRKKHNGNVHTIVAPVSDRELIYLVIIGEIIKEPNAYACALVTRTPPAVMNDIIENEKRLLGERYFTLETLKCSGEDLGQGKYEYKFNTSGYYIKSSLSLTYDPEYSTDKKRIYILRGQINLEINDIDPKHIGMMATKKLSLFKSRLKG